MVIIVSDAYINGNSLVAYYSHNKVGLTVSKKRCLSFRSVMMYAWVFATLIFSLKFGHI